MEVHLIMVQYDIHDQYASQAYSDKARAEAKAKRLNKQLRRLHKLAERRKGDLPEPHDEFWGELRAKDESGVHPWHVTRYTVASVPLAQ